MAVGDNGSGNIACGSYTTNASYIGPNVNLGYEPAWILVKNASGNGAWYIIDNMRGWTTDGNVTLLNPNTSSAESTTTQFKLNATGFQDNGAFAGDATMIYMAIRRPMKEPESSDEVFAIDTADTALQDGTQLGTIQLTPDVSLHKTRNVPQTTYVIDRLRGGSYLQASETSVEGASFFDFDNMDAPICSGNFDSTSSSRVFYHFKRAKGFFDVVAYTGSNTNSTFNHNLASIPEMMLVKCRTDGATNRHWGVYHKDFTGILYLDESGLGSTSTGFFPSPPTDTEFYVGAGWSVVNELGNDWIAYLFTTLAGISKVGSYTGNGTSQTIDCGFSTGVKFLLLKRTDGVGNWMMWDSVRGIVDGIDPYLLLNTTDAEASTGDYVDQVSPAQNGFTLTPSGNWLYGPNYDTAEYIYYAIANPI